MRVLWLSHLVPYPPAGGALQRAYHLLRLAAARHEIHLVALNQPRLLPDARARTEAVDALSRLCASVHVLPLLAERSLFQRGWTMARAVLGNASYDVQWLRSREMVTTVSGWRHSGGIDLVHVDTVGLWPVVERWRSSPVVLNHHNVESDLAERRAAYEEGAIRSSLLRRDAAKLRALETHAVRKAAVNLVVSRVDADRLARVAPNARIAVVENGVDTAYWRPSVPGPGSRCVIAFAGTLAWYPNRDAVTYLINEVWPALRTGSRDRRLLLVGRDPPATATRAALADPHIEVTGFVPDVRPHLAAASIFVCPIRVGGGTRVKVLDALAMAKPVVATAIAVEGLDLVEGHHYLRAETAREFVLQIERLEDDPVLRDALGVAGRRRVEERYDWRVIDGQLEVAYAGAVGALAPNQQPWRTSPC